MLLLKRGYLRGHPKKKITTFINFWNVLKCVTDGV